MKRVSVTDLQQMRNRGEPITMITAYDYPTARLVDDAGIPVMLVGDSVGMVVLGYDSTLPVTVDDMIHHGSAVMRGTQRAHVVVDMPFGSYQTGWQDAMRNASRIMQETGCDSVKLEGGQRSAETVEHLVSSGIPVMGHIGLTPQSVNALGGYKIQGRTPRDAVRVLNDAKALEEAGAYAIVLEVVPAAVAARITEILSVPTIGIGAGPYCSGQVQVLHDLLALDPDMDPKHARRFLKGGELIHSALTDYREAVESGSFPTADESFFLDAVTRKRVETMLAIHADDSMLASHAIEGSHEGVDAEIALLSDEELR
jgi:3-methyl-2-oxobutanoate hydroxymethyltransferase